MPPYTIVRQVSMALRFMTGAIVARFLPLSVCIMLWNVPLNGPLVMWHEPGSSGTGLCHGFLQKSVQPGRRGDFPCL